MDQQTATATKPMDAWDRASNPTSGFENEYWGQFQVSAWLCALVKGTGKVAYDPAVHTKAPSTALDLDLIPLAEMNVTNPKWTQRNTIAESDEWRKISWPSLKALGVANLREVMNKWVKVAMVPTGDTYAAKDGSIKDRTCYSFVAIFPDEAACRADYLTAHPEAIGSTGTPWTPAPGGQPSAPTAATPANAPEKAAAWAFCKVIVANTMKACVGQPLPDAMTAVGNALAQYAGVNKYFSVSSPEVIDLMQKEWAA